MLTSPRTVREISHSSILAEQGHLIAFQTGPLRRVTRDLQTSPYLAALDEPPIWWVISYLGLFTA